MYSFLKISFALTLYILTLSYCAPSLADHTNTAAMSAPIVNTATALE